MVDDDSLMDRYEWSGYRRRQKGLGMGLFAPESLSVATQYDVSTTKRPSP